jgi:adenosyl cobinamide kinase/adenosyl cobinamide phosphate guanylyltransferase
MQTYQLIYDIINERVPTEETILAQKRKEFEIDENNKKQKQRWCVSEEGKKYAKEILEQYKQTKQRLIIDTLDTTVHADVIRTQAIKFALLSKMIEEFYGN